jgi:hypothetical protein
LDPAEERELDYALRDVRKQRKMLNHVEALKLAAKLAAKRLAARNGNEEAA